MISIAAAPDATLTRRGLLAAGGAAVVAAALAEVDPVARVVTVLRGAGAPAHLRRSTFAALIGDRFRLDAQSGRTTVDLVAVESLGAAGRTSPPREDAFALLFHDPGAARLGQDVMTLTHPELGRFRLLLSPVSSGRRGQDYAAVINRAPPPRRSGGPHV